VADTRIDELRRRLERDPGSRLFAQLAEELRKSGDLVEAIRVARAGLAVHPSYPSARLTLGRALLDSGDAAGGRAELESALREAPDNILASRFLAQAREALGDVKGAIEQYQKTLQMSPGDRGVQAQLQAAEARLRPPAGASSGVGGETTPPTGRTATPPTQAATSAPAARPTAAAPPAPAVDPGARLAAAAPVVFAPSRPVAPAAPESDSEDFDAPGVLPPTVRLRPSQPAAAPPPSAAQAPPPAPPPPPPVAAARAATEAPTLPPAPSATETARVPAGEFLAGTAAPGTVQHTWFAPTAPEPPVEAPLPPTLVDSAHAAPTSGGALPEPPVPEPVAHAAGSQGASTQVPGAGDSAADEEAADSATPFSSSTLAELYFQQGLVERAVDVYRQLVQQDPSNEKARLRLVELEGSSAAPEDRAARRRALERTIAGLESLLAAVQRR